MTFYRYRYRYAEGPSSWEYIESSWPREDLERSLEDDPASCSGLEGYRGITLEAIDLPPAEWLQERIASAHRSEAYYAALVVRYEQLLASGTQRVS